jgi:hypothetical protein
MQVAELDPLSASPGGQLKVIVHPFICTESEHSDFMIGITELESLLIESSPVVDSRSG